MFLLSMCYEDGMLLTEKHSCYCLQCSCSKVMFSQASVILFMGWVCVAGGHAWQGEGVCGMGGMCCRGVHGRGHAWQGGAWQGVCMTGRPVWQGACMAGGGHAWQGRHAWQGACVAGEMTTAVDDMHPTGMHSCCC